MDNLASWVAPIATTLAALMTASNLGSRITGYGFIVFTIGSLAWLVLGITTGQTNLLWQNIILTALNLFGVWRWLGRQARIEDGGKAAAQASATTPGEALFAVSLLTRAKVIGQGNTEFGTSVDAMAGCASGQLAYLVVAAKGVAGVGEEFRRLDWGEAVVDIDRVSARIDQRAFDQLPQLARDDWPGR